MVKHVVTPVVSDMVTPVVKHMVMTVVSHVVTPVVKHVLVATGGRRLWMGRRRVARRIDVDRVAQGLEWRTL